MNSSAPQNDDANFQPSRRRGWFRFGLLDMMLLTCLIAAWSPSIIALRDTPQVAGEVEQMAALTVQLPIVDAEKLCIRKLPGIWHNIQSWKYYLPPDANMELRFATEQINSLGDPDAPLSVVLPTGTHSLHLKHEVSEQGEFVAAVFLDDDQVLERRHPPEWRETGSSGSSGGIASQVETHELDEQLVLHRMCMYVRHPHERFESRSLPEEYDSKGTFLWIVPQGKEPRESPKLVSPATESFPHRRWGNRQGLQIMSAVGSGLEGTLGVLPDHRLILSNKMQYHWPMNAISVRPVTASNPEGEIPELTSSIHSPPRKVRHGFRDSLEPLSHKQRIASLFDSASRGVFSDDQRFMRVFAHFEPFPSGAQPIVEVIFDADHPNRVGFLPHQVQGTTPLQAVQFVTKLDAQCQFRRLYLSNGGREADSSADTEDSLAPEAELQVVPLSALVKESGDAWIAIGEEQMPSSMMGDTSMRKLQMVTDVENFLELQFPPALNSNWQYDGLPASQTWYLPASTPGVAPVTMEIYAAEVYPDSDITILGGPAICHVRVTVPMPAQSPVWLEITRSPDFDEEASDSEP